VPTILLVDDEPEIRLALRLLFVRHGIDVREAGGVVEALHALTQSSFDLVLTDFDMPDGDGGAVIQAASVHNPKAIRVLMSGNLTSLPESVQTTATHVLEKPLLIRSLEMIMASLGVTPLILSAPTNTNSH